MSTATAGRAREYKIRDDMISHGWFCIMRAAASKGAADLLMAHEDHGAALVQVGTSRKSLGPDDRDRFLHAAWLCSALPIVAIAGNRQPITYWHVTDAPQSKWEAWTP